MNQHHLAHYIIAAVLTVAIIGIGLAVRIQQKEMQGALGIGHVGFGMFQETK